MNLFQADACHGLPHRFARTSGIEKPSRGDFSGPWNFQRKLPLKDAELLDLCGFCGLLDLGGFCGFYGLLLREDSYLQTGGDAIAVKSGWDCFGRLGRIADGVSRAAHSKLTEL